MEKEGEIKNKMKMHCGPQYLSKLDISLSISIYLSLTF